MHGDLWESVLNKIRAIPGRTDEVKPRGNRWDVRNYAVMAGHRLFHARNWRKVTRENENPRQPGFDERD